MYFLKCVVFTFLFSLSLFVNSATLRTDEYRLEIVSQCVEGEVTCEKVQLYIYELPSNSLKDTAKGKTLHTKCIDGSPCRFIGYKFTSGAFSYFLYENGTFEVFMDSKKDSLYSKKGSWEY